LAFRGVVLAGGIWSLAVDFAGVDFAGVAFAGVALAGAVLAALVGRFEAAAGVELPGAASVPPEVPAEVALPGVALLGGASVAAASAGTALPGGTLRGAASAAVALLGADFCAPCGLRGVDLRPRFGSGAGFWSAGVAVGASDRVPDDVLPGGRPGVCVVLSVDGGWKVTGGAALAARRGARSDGLLGDEACSGVLNAARGVRGRGLSEPADVGGFSSMPWEPSRPESVSPVGKRC
jgi:hypothetical protein